MKLLSAAFVCISLVDPHLVVMCAVHEIELLFGPFNKVKLMLLLMSAGCLPRLQCIIAVAHGRGQSSALLQSHAIMQHMNRI